MIHRTLLHSMSAAALSLAVLSLAHPALSAGAQQTETLPDVDVNAPTGAKPGSEAEASQTPPVVKKFNLPQSSSSVTAKKIEDQLNIVDAEDAVKYLPSLFVRKRNYGDTSPVLATRTWGVNSSARSLVYADGLLLTPLIANNNQIGSPRFGLVSPEEIERVDFLYGPFAAQYPGNSMGGVLIYTTKMPDKPTATIKQTEAFQTSNAFGVKDTYRTDQTNVTFGNKIEAFSWFLTGSYANSYSQPLTAITLNQAQTNALAAAGITGYQIAQNKTGGVANLAGAGGLLHTHMVNTKLKLSYDFSSTLNASYILGFWSNEGASRATTLLTTASGAPTYGALTGSNIISGFGSNNYTVNAKHLTNSLSLTNTTGGVFDWEVSANRYDILKDQQISPYGLQSGSNAYTNLGKSLLYNGTNWMNGDIKGIWRPVGAGSFHEFSFGLHADQYQLRNPTYQLAQWDSGATSSNNLYTNGQGQTLTTALWAQDAWKIAPNLKLTLGARFENWKASDGYNFVTTASSVGVISNPVGITQPNLTTTAFSPKASLAYEINKDWQITPSIGKATRFPTVGELYQTASTGGTTINPNPNLQPEDVLSEEIAVERKLDDGKIRVSLFNETVNNALISQTAYITGTTNTTSFVSNITQVRNRGVEIAAQKDDVLINGLQIAGSVTYVDSWIAADTTWAGTTNVIGKRVPYVPSWRSSLVATYKPDTHWAYTLGGRYYGKMYSTLDNTDIISNVYGAFDSFAVYDTRVRYEFNDKQSIGFGVDNLTNKQYTLYHPFPGRTFVVDASFKF